LEAQYEYDHLFGQGEYEQHRRSFKKLKSGKKSYSIHRGYALRKVERIISGRKIAEIGGGVGDFGVYCTNRGWNYIDYDISETAITFVKELDLEAKVIAVNEPTLAPNSFDLVVLWEVVEHLYDVQAYLKNIYSSLKPGGVLLLSTPNYNRPGYQQNDNWGKLSSPPIHVNFFTPEAIKLVLTSYKFDIFDIWLPKLYRPSDMTISSIFSSIKLILGIEVPPTIFVIARK
jgi:SAM-dependent methyltransferase